jgi:hypothetical protein
MVRSAPYRLYTEELWTVSLVCSPYPGTKIQHLLLWQLAAPSIVPKFHAVGVTQWLLDVVKDPDVVPQVTWQVPGQDL